MNISSGLCAHFRLGVLKWPGQIAVHSAKRPVAKYTRRRKGRRRERVERNFREKTHYARP